jgi:hypothetical protein
MLIWFLLVVVFFSLPSSKLVGYILPAIPPFAYLIGEGFFIAWPKKLLATGRAYSVTLGLAALFCVGLIAGAAFSDRHSSLLLARASEGVFQPQDRVLLLYGYPYDLPFYLRLRQAPWVVGDWDDPEIDKHDNWRKELADAGKFDRTARAEHLLDTARLSARICHGFDKVLWVWGQEKNRVLTASWLPEQRIFHRAGKFTLWRLTPDDVRTLPLCSEKPSSG